ncbi:hypothetical protein PR202_ga16083 [Eleusine coracana subsp. coracana]|uniref:Uncharacterized protein n=1 Tax=Eleusine coracana subsp. coracana TaxID=191504 RepID=A0AAV5CLU3_ELECO|nr:hypothetical protein PR202_ga16083 [Eleusine coracana subsp. coracana]
MYDQDAVLDAVDRRLEGAFDERQMNRDRTRRPSIAEALAVLRSNSSDLPVLLPVAAAPLHGGGLFALEEERACYGEFSTEDDGYESTPTSASTAYMKTPARCE